MVKGTEHHNDPKSLYFILILINSKYVDIYVTECCRGSYKSCFHYFIGNKQLKKRPLRVFLFKNTVEYLLLI